MNPTRRDDRLGPHMRARCALRLAVALGLAAVAFEATAATCTASTPGVAFGSYDVYAAGNVNANGTLTVSCTIGLLDLGAVTINYTISLSAGSSSSFVQRQMKSGANALGYNLYTSNTYAVVWGDGTGSTGTIAGQIKVTNGHPTDSNSHTVYGRIPALQDASVANDYRDNVTVTVTY
jgi:spore coat protein U-like protein